MGKEGVALWQKKKKKKKSGVYLEPGEGRVRGGDFYIYIYFSFFPFSFPPVLRICFYLAQPLEHISEIADIFFRSGFGKR